MSTRDGLSSEYGTFDTAKASFWPWISGRGTTRAEGIQGTPAQSRISLSILVFEEKFPSPFIPSPFQADRGGGSTRDGRSTTSSSQSRSGGPLIYVDMYIYTYV